MRSNREEIIEKLIQLDKDVALMDTTEDIYSCVIVGGSALVLMNKIYLRRMTSTPLTQAERSVLCSNCITSI